MQAIPAQDLTKLLCPLRDWREFPAPALEAFASRWATPTVPASSLEPALQHLYQLYRMGQDVQALKRSLLQAAEEAEAKGYNLVGAMWRNMRTKATPDNPKGAGRPVNIADRVLIANALPIFRVLWGNKPVSSWNNRPSTHKRLEVEAAPAPTPFRRFVEDFLRTIDPDRKTMPSRRWYENIFREAS